MEVTLASFNLAHFSSNMKMLKIKMDLMENQNVNLTMFIHFEEKL